MKRAGFLLKAMRGISHRQTLPGPMVPYFCFGCSLPVLGVPESLNALEGGKPTHLIASLLGPLLNCTSNKRYVKSLCVVWVALEVVPRILNYVLHNRYISYVNMIHK